MRYADPCDLEPQPEGGFAVSFPDVTKAHADGETEGEALARAEDALVAALSFYTDVSQPLPCPTPTHGRPVAIVPPLVAAKLALHDAMLSAGLSNVGFARQLGLDEKSVRRLRDPLHRSRIGLIEGALQHLGKRLEVRVPAVP